VRGKIRDRLPGEFGGVYGSNHPKNMIKYGLKFIRIYYPK